MTEDRLNEFADAWARGDVDELMTFVTEDCVYEASVGPEPGKTYRGSAAVRKGIEEMLAHDASRASRGGPIFICGEKGAMEWSYIQQGPDGQAIEIRGCDLLEFRDDKIRRKNSFRKTRAWKNR